MTAGNISERRPLGEETICSKRAGVRSRGASAPRDPRLYANFHKNKSDSLIEPVAACDRLSILLLLAQSKGTNYCFAICSQKKSGIGQPGISL